MLFRSQNPRHSALAYVTGWPTPVSVQKHWGNVLPLLQGTAIHEQLHKIMSDVTPHYYSEVKIGPVIGKRYEWIGTADAYVKIDGVWWLVDYKTISGASLELSMWLTKGNFVCEIDSATPVSTAYQ